MYLAFGVFVLVIAVIAFFALAGAAGVRSAKAGSVEQPAPEGPTVTYRVPEGHDPIALVTALQRQGYDARAGDPPTPPTVVVACAPGEREDLRRAIAEAPVNLEGDSAEATGAATPVRFADE